MNCILEEKCVKLSLVDVRRSTVLLQRLPNRTVQLPMQLEDFMLWKSFYSLEEPCPAALTMIMHVRTLPESLALPGVHSVATSSQCVTVEDLATHLRHALDC
jgi:hypothetical protein